VNDLDPLRMRKIIGRETWCPPIQFGDGGWRFDRHDKTGRILVTQAMYVGRDGVCHDWIHASISRRLAMPTYEELKLMHDAAFNDRWAYQVFTPSAEHVNDHDWCLHLWGRVDGVPMLPDFAVLGSV
jgi:hypothetical protein